MCIPRARAISHIRKKRHQPVNSHNVTPNQLYAQSLSPSLPHYVWFDSFTFRALYIVRRKVMLAFFPSCFFHSVCAFYPVVLTIEKLSLCICTCTSKEIERSTCKLRLSRFYHKRKKNKEDAKWSAEWSFQPTAATTGSSSTRREETCV